MQFFVFDWSLKKMNEEKKKRRLMASAPDRENLEKLINEFYYSDNLYIDENCNIQKRDGRPYTGAGVVVVKRNRWRFEV